MLICTRKYCNYFSRIYPQTTQRTKSNNKKITNGKNLLIFPVEYEKLNNLWMWCVCVVRCLRHPTWRMFFLLVFASRAIFALHTFHAETAFVWSMTRHVRLVVCFLYTTLFEWVVKNVCAQSIHNIQRKYAKTTDGRKSRQISNHFFVCVFVECSWVW